MKISFHSTFVKNYNKRIKPHENLAGRFKVRLALFSTDPTNPQLKNHRLIGKKNDRWSFSVTGDVRVIYKFIDVNEVLLEDVGTHNQVY